MNYNQKYNKYECENFFELFKSKPDISTRLMAIINWYNHNDYTMLSCKDHLVPIPAYMPTHYLINVLVETYGSYIPAIQTQKLPFMKNLNVDKERYVIDLSTYDGFGSTPFPQNHKVYAIQQDIHPDMVGMIESFFPNIKLMWFSAVLPHDHVVISGWGDAFLNKSITANGEPSKHFANIICKPLSYYVDKFNIPRVDYINLRMYDGALLSLCGSLSIIDEFHPYIEVYLPNINDMRMGKILLETRGYEITIVSNILYAT